MGILKYLIALLGSQVASYTLTLPIARQVNANIPPTVSSEQEFWGVSLGIPDFTTVVNFLDGNANFELTHRRWWMVFGQVAAAMRGVSLATQLGLSGNTTDLILAAQQSRVQMYMGYLTGDPDRFMRDVETAPERNNLTVSATYYALRVALGGAVDEDYFGQPAADIMDSQWGKQELLKIATGEWAIRQAQYWFSSVVGGEIWDVGGQIADILAGNSTSEDVIYRFLVTESVVNEIENAVLRHMEYGYTAKNRGIVGYLLRELVGELGIHGVGNNLWALIDDSFASGHDKVRSDIDALWYTQPVKEKIDQAISLYCQGKAGPMFQYGVAIGFNNPNCLQQDPTAIPDPAPASSSDTVPADAASIQSSDTFSITSSPMTATPAATETSPPIEASTISTTAVPSSTSTTTTTITLTSTVSTSIDAPPHAKRKPPPDWRRPPSSCDCSHGLEKVCPALVHDGDFPHPDGRDPWRENKHVDPERYPCCFICRDALRVEDGGPITTYEEPNAPTATEEESPDHPKWTTTYTYPDPGDHHHPHHPHHSNLGYNHTASVFNHTLPGHRTRPGGIYRPPKYRPTGVGHGHGDGDGDDDDYDDHDHHHPHHNKPWDHPHADSTLTYTAEPTT